jgi:hypothetical protein
MALILPHGVGGRYAAHVLGYTSCAFLPILPVFREFVYPGFARAPICTRYNRRGVDNPGRTRELHGPPQSGPVRRNWIKVKKVRTFSDGTRSSPRGSTARSSQLKHFAPHPKSSMESASSLHSHRSPPATEGRPYMNSWSLQCGTLAGFLAELSPFGSKLVQVSPILLALGRKFYSACLYRHLFTEHRLPLSNCVVLGFWIVHPALWRTHPWAFRPTPADHSLEWTSTDATGTVRYLRCGESGEACRRYGELSRSFLGPHRAAAEPNSLPAK